jgi:hypothetical protein
VIPPSRSILIVSYFLSAFLSAIVFSPSGNQR